MNFQNAHLNQDDKLMDLLKLLPNYDKKTLNMTLFNSRFSAKAALFYSISFTCFQSKHITYVCTFRWCEWEEGEKKEK